MASLPGTITYRWVARDNLILRKQDEFEKAHVTPYKIPLWRAREHEVGARVSFELPRDSDEPGHVRYFLPQGYSWQDVPPACRDAPTLGALCQRLTADLPLVYPAELYGAPDRKVLWGGAISLLQLMLNVWGNTDFRWAMVSGGWKPFSWTMLGASGAPLLQCPTSLPGVGEEKGPVRLAKVLARDPIIRPLDVSGSPSPTPPSAPAPTPPTAPEPAPKVTTGRLPPPPRLSDDERIRAALQAAIPALKAAGIPTRVLEWVSNRSSGVSFAVFSETHPDGARFDVALFGAGTMNLKESVFGGLVPRASAAVGQVLHESTHAYMHNVLSSSREAWFKAGVAYYKAEMSKVSFLITERQGWFMLHEAIGNYVGFRVTNYATTLALLQALAARKGGSEHWDDSDRLAIHHQTRVLPGTYNQVVIDAQYQGYNERMQFNGPRETARRTRFAWMLPSRRSSTATSSRASSPIRSRPIMPSIPSGA